MNILWKLDVDMYVKNNLMKMSKQCIINYYVIELNNIIRFNGYFPQDLRSFCLTPQYFLDKFSSKENVF